MMKYASMNIFRMNTCREFHSMMKTSSCSICALQHKELKQIKKTSNETTLYKAIKCCQVNFDYSHLDNNLMGDQKPTTTALLLLILLLPVALMEFQRQVNTAPRFTSLLCQV